eukprot:CAMPEP_0173407040 /NCGR_PEP_ID=MMETSP1356-20130122/66134_1 /TAXON_ID=77927 ORGANISM="Hemiselmis virescens, Strain PCC157" /NCGR_SAMPLE_ID=MMETSP1356 /ASSEMBLY_ACC=CAM_ASM_000847 /LENGTH=162 /DNA_ID=CAMNT_0014368139 /DNA_START=181 /DNA_END=666 /DNA_ORIENTATION=-
MIAIASPSLLFPTATLLPTLPHRCHLTPIAASVVANGKPPVRAALAVKNESPPLAPAASLPCLGPSPLALNPRITSGPPRKKRSHILDRSPISGTSTPKEALSDSVKPASGPSGEECVCASTTCFQNLTSPPSPASSDVALTKAPSVGMMRSSLVSCVTVYL